MKVESLREQAYKDMVKTINLCLGKMENSKHCYDTGLYSDLDYINYIIHDIGPIVQLMGEEK